MARSRPSLTLSAAALQEPAVTGTPARSPPPSHYPRSPLGLPPAHVGRPLPLFQSPDDRLGGIGIGSHSRRLTGRRRTTTTRPRPVSVAGSLGPLPSGAYMPSSSSICRRAQTTNLPTSPGSPPPHTLGHPTAPFSTSLAALNQSLTNLSLPRNAGALLSPTVWTSTLDTIIAPSRRSSLFSGILPHSGGGSGQAAPARPGEEVADAGIQRKSRKVIHVLPRLLATVPQEYTLALGYVHRLTKRRVPKIVDDKHSMQATTAKVVTATDNLQDSLATVRSVQSLDQFQTVSQLLYRSLQTLDMLKSR
ncbi:hypothetical protein IWQ60_004561 [Tieghemiomyces parasiticus]|uniref:Uncharacterized protein n=1 Tax=Tieghemiomyces parasiticus TaxID=78921 RepID=A0A9W8AAR4_9FUNG|nr:hypothetical protein IWQ60_004561 [Tieghemiomyces parasiticus]